MIITDEKILRQVSEQINMTHPNVVDIINKHIADLEYHLTNSQIKGYGLSAIQIGVPLALSIIRMPNLKLDIINPIILELNDPIVFRGEGCLSFPGKYTNTSRFDEITIENTCIDGTRQKLVFTGLEAVVVQHEICHHSGDLFMDHQLKPITVGVKFGRNDPCPHCLEKGVNIKFKKCKEHYL